MTHLVKDRRKPKINETVQLVMNGITGVMAAVPMLMTELKPLLPEHYYGILSAAFLIINFAIDVYRRMQYGKIIEVPDHETHV